VTGATPVAAAIRSEIAQSGPMRFDRFMELSLYGPGGYFQADVLRSQRAGDFLTSPEVSPAFGATLAKVADSERSRVGRPFTVAEVGAGSGSLLRSLLDGLEPPADSVTAVEVSPAARRSLTQLVPEAEIGDSFDVVPHGVMGVIIANELLDNLPAAIAIRRGAGWRERAVEVSGPGLAWTEVESRAHVAAWANAQAGSISEGGQVEVQIAATEWVANAVDRLASGALIVIDYGDTAEGLGSRRSEGTMRTYRNHHLGSDPLVEPGSTDVTMDVDFTALASVALEHGAQTEVWRQDEFLERWGLLDHIADLKRHEFEASASGETMARLRWRSLVTGAETLLHPRGLGDFRVLVARV
jgi:SAM-dependent MidA family methyltransferase